MFIPDKSTNLKDIKIARHMLGLMGNPLSGKTFSMLTAPNPYVINYDNKLGAHFGKDINQAEFGNDDFVDSIVPRTDKKKRPNRKEALIKWLETNMSKFEPEQTVCLDSWSLVQDGFDQYEETVRHLTKAGQDNEFEFWNQKQIFAREVLSLLKNSKCNIIVTFHEHPQTDSKGNLTGKIGPLMRGRFVHKLSGYFTDWFRQHAIPEYEKPDDKTSKVVNIEYMWQTKPDALTNCGSCIQGLKTLVPANWDVFTNPDKYIISPK